MSTLLAPNGKPSNLTPEQYKLVRSESFISWFGDWHKLALTKINDSGIDDISLKRLEDGVSKVVDSNGEPMVVWHTTNNEFNKFDKKKSRDGFFFSPQKNRLVDYNKSKINSYFLNLINPSHEMFEIDLKYLKTKGYDGVMDYGHARHLGNKNLYEIIAFEPNQIKLADGTNTTFDVNNPDIRYNDGGSIPKELYHYTNETNFDRIFDSNILNPSQKYGNRLSFTSDSEYHKKGHGLDYGNTNVRITFDNEKLISDGYSFSPFDHSSKQNKIGKEFEYIISIPIKNVKKYIKNITIFKGNAIVGEIDKTTTDYANKYYLNSDIRFKEGGLIAPNGKPSGLYFTEIYNIVRTKEFKEWFGDWEEAYKTKDYEGVSKIIDENGEPLICVHNTRNEFYEFDEFEIGKNTDAGYYGKGFYFTPNVGQPNYGEIELNCFLSIKNPYYKQESYRNYELNSDDLKNQGFDGVVVYPTWIENFNFENGVDGCQEVVAYYSEQIKLGDGTNTIFDNYNPDIRFDKGGSVDEKYQYVVDEIENAIIDLGLPYLNEVDEFNRYYLSKSKNDFGQSWYMIFLQENRPLEIRISDHSVTSSSRIMDDKYIAMLDVSNPFKYQKPTGIAKFLDLEFKRLKDSREKRNKLFDDEREKRNYMNNELQSFLDKLKSENKTIGKNERTYQTLEEVTTKHPDWEYVFHYPNNGAYSFYFVKKDTSGSLSPNFINEQYFNFLNDNNYLKSNYKTGGRTFDISGELGVENFKKMNYNELMLYIKDSYKELGAEIGIKGHTEDGEPIIGYLPYQNEYMYKSDSTGKKIRFYIDLANEKYIHPSEINPKFNVSEQKRIEQKADYFAKISNEEYNKIVSELKKNNELNLFIDTLEKALKTFNIENQYDSSDIFKSYGNSILESKDGNKRRMKFDIYYFRVNDSKLKTNVTNLDLERFNNEYIKKNEFKNGGRTIAQTPAPKKDQIKGSDKNKEGSAKDISSAKKIKFSDDVLEKIQNSVDKHNKKHSDKKITIDSAKAVVRRGMGAYSSTHRPTISGGNENSRVAWGLARLNAFTYKIINGKSKSGKYSQDNDLIEELGYKVQKYFDGGEINNIMKNEIIDILSKNARYGKEILSVQEVGLEVIQSCIESNTYFGNAIRQANENYIMIPVKYDDKLWAIDKKVEYVYFAKPNENTKIRVEYKYDIQEYPTPILFDSEIMNNEEFYGVNDYEEINVREFDSEFLYRGINSDEMLSIIENGFIKSNASMNIGKQQEETTSFAQHISQASSYAVGFNAWYDEVTFNKPKYILKVKKEGVNYKPIIETDIENEVDVFGEIPIQQIESIYEFRLGECQMGSVEINVGYENNFSEGSRFPMYKKVFVRKMDVNTLINEINSKNKIEKNNDMTNSNPKDTITMDIPLLIRFSELMREEIKTDVALHEVVENLLEIKDKGILTMSDYDSIVGNITGAEENTEQVIKPEEEKMAEGGKVLSIHSDKGDIKINLDENWYSDDTNVQLVPVSELIKFREFDRKVNPKYNQENSKDNINHLKYMFQSEGVKSPLIIEYSPKENAVLIIEGNHRLNSAIDLGMEFLPARVVLKKYGTYSPEKLKSTMNVSGVTPNLSGYIPSDLKPSVVGIQGTLPIYADGGIIEGRLHSECGDDGCGRKFQVGENGHVIEAERDEAVIVADAFDDNEDYTIKGTPSEVASAINVMGGGKNFDTGATIIKKGQELEIPELKKQATDTDVADVIDSGSIIINRRSMADEKEYEVTGTPKQIASAINSINGNGVIIEKGAEIKEN
jgi:hypothetical protein